jgi:fatty acid desaturase
MQIPTFVRRREGATIGNMDEVFHDNDRIDRGQLARLNLRSDKRGALQLAGHGVALLATGVILNLAVGSSWIVPATVLHGAILVFLFAPLHEAIHRTAFRSRRLNDAVARLIGLILVLPPDYFRFFHFAHHRYTQDAANDPELATPKPATPRQWLLYVSGWHYWRAQIVGILMHALGRAPESFLAAPRTATRVMAEARLVLAVYVLIAVVALTAGSWAPLTYWILPTLAGQPFLRLYLLAEHTGCPLVPNMLANSRTTLTNAIVRFFAWNMPYHAEHHAYPSVPFHALPDLHRLLRRDLKVIAPGYVAVHKQLLLAL